MTRKDKTRVGDSTTSSQPKAANRLSGTIQLGALDQMSRPPNPIHHIMSGLTGEGDPECGISFRHSTDEAVPLPEFQLADSVPLIPVSTDHAGRAVVSARELHSFLQVKTKFVDWFARRVKMYRCFVEGRDFVLVSQKWETNNPKNPTLTMP